MTKRNTVCEALDHIFDHDTGEEERGQETDRENAVEEEVSEVEDNTEYDPDQETTSGEKEGPAEVVVTTFQSNNLPPHLRGEVGCRLKMLSE